VSGKSENKAVRRQEKKLLTHRKVGKGFIFFKQNSNVQKNRLTGELANGQT
jgi:hypothetical protein